MNNIKGLFSKFAAFMSAKPNTGNNQHMLQKREGRIFGGSAGSRSGNFDDDFRSANAILKDRINQRFPDNYHALTAADANSMRDFSDERAGAIDTASATIAGALRNGATVKQAAAAGAASVGI